jgi:chromosome partitioning protein
MSKNNFYVFVIGNEKGGAGKTTCSMHLICSLLDYGFTVASIDADVRQLSLTSYLQNRKAYNIENPDNKVHEPFHFVLKESSLQNIKDKELEEQKLFEDIIKEAGSLAQIIVIDTPGSFSNYSKLAHSYADTVITPINDSFVDLDLIAKINPQDLSVISPSIYSEMVWKQKMVKSQRNGKSIEWILMRNRLANVDSLNKKNIATALQNIANRLAIKIAPGFSERVIFRELFLQGLTLVDLNRSRRDKSFSISHIAARQELRDFLEYIGILNQSPNNTL